MKRELGISTLDLAKRLLDYGFHPPTVYFPLLVEEALLIEPTETETKETLDAFAEAIAAILARGRGGSRRSRAPRRTRRPSAASTRRAPPADPVSASNWTEGTMSRHAPPSPPADAPAAIGPYSHAVRHGGVLYCSGAAAARPALRGAGRAARRAPRRRSACATSPPSARPPAPSLADACG